MQKKKPTKPTHRRIILAATVTAAICLIFLCFRDSEVPFSGTYQEALADLNIPEYSGYPYAVLNDNIPFFTEAEKHTDTFETYSDLDYLGRCQTAYANISRELMPTEERGEIGSIKPSGWQQAKYEGIVNSRPPYLYNRCHLIAHCLTAENANEKNLITGTRYMNIEGMLPFEEQVAKYLDENASHVLYRVTPIFEGRNLVASGVLIEAWSVEDNGAGIRLCVYCYNVQPGIEIDYRTGESRAVDSTAIKKKEKVGSA